MRLAEAVPVPGGSRGVLGSSVALDGQHHPARSGGMLSHVVDPIAASAPLGDERALVQPAWVVVARAVHFSRRWLP